MKTTKGIEERKINMREIIHNNDNLQESDINKVVERAKIILVNSKDEILVAKSHQNYSFIGGHVEEKETLEGVIEARNKAVTANSINEKVDAENQITGALNKLFALSEAYPELKANENFKSLQNELKEVEDKIAYSRQFYNDTAMSYNNIVAMFPSNIVANMFKFKSYDYFKIDEKERENVKVKF